MPVLCRPALAIPLRDRSPHRSCPLPPAAQLTPAFPSPPPAAATFTAPSTPDLPPPPLSARLPLPPRLPATLYSRTFAAPRRRLSLRLPLPPSPHFTPPLWPCRLHAVWTSFCRAWAAPTGRSASFTLLLFPSFLRHSWDTYLLADSPLALAVPVRGHDRRPGVAPVGHRVPRGHIPGPRCQAGGYWWVCQD